MSVARGTAPGARARRIRRLARLALRPDTPFRVAARRARRAIEHGDLGAARGLARVLAACAPTAAHRRLAADLAAALSDNAAAAALSIAGMAGRGTDLGAEKVVSARHRFVWLCVPKAASRSLVAALTAADPDALLVRDAGIGEVYDLHPPARGYFTFAFVRHPYDRALSFHAELARDPRKRRQLLGPCHGLAERGTFEDLCRWLDTPYGSDAFADRHWLSQHLQIRVGRRRLPDFVGRFESLDDDVAAVAAHLGVRLPALPCLNAAAGDAASPESVRRDRDLRSRRLGPGCRALLRARYADDFELGRYAS